MADPPRLVGNTSDKLREKYSGLRATGNLAGTNLLHELGRLAWALVDESASHKQLISFVLASVFSGLAIRQEDACSAEYGAKLHNLMDQPLIECIDIICGRDTHVDWQTTLFRLISAYAQARQIDPTA